MKNLFGTAVAEGKAKGDGRALLTVENPTWYSRWRQVTGGKESF
jgi:hypothetical protein